MKVYHGKSKKYRIKKRIYSTGDIDYYIQWKYYAQYGLIWWGKYTDYNSFSTITETEQRIQTLITLDKLNYLYKEKIKLIIEELNL